MCIVDDDSFAVKEKTSLSASLSLCLTDWRRHVLYRVSLSLDPLLLVIASHRVYNVYAYVPASVCVFVPVYFLYFILSIFVCWRRSDFGI